MISPRLYAVEVLHPRSWRLAKGPRGPLVFTSRRFAREAAASHRRLGTKARVAVYERAKGRAR